MSTVATEYYLETGRLRMVMHSDADDACALNQSEGMGWVLGAWDSRTHYAVNGEAVTRPASPVTLSDLTLQGVPMGSALLINGERYEAEGDVELEFPLSGTYRLRVECFPYKDWEGEVVV